MSATKISPTIIVDLVEEIEQKLRSKYSGQVIEGYIRKWHEEHGDFGEYENFTIKHLNNRMHVSETLLEMGDELIFQVAVDLGIEVPGLIYSVATIKGLLSVGYEGAAQTFDRACEKIIDEPDVSISMAYSALELIIKRICEHPDIKNCNDNDSLHKLTGHILKEFGYHPSGNKNTSFRDIGSGLLKITDAIQKIRSNNTISHGSKDPVIDDPIYAMFIVNSISTIGLFLINYFEKHYNVIGSTESEYQDDEIPF